MKALLVMLAVTLMHAPLFAQDAAADAKKQEMMKAWQTYATPGDQHKMLAPMAGNWKYTSKYWEKADAKPEESSGTSKMKMILGGRFLQQEIKGKAMGMPFEGLGLTGYDNLKQKYETLWLDNLGTGVMHGTGTFDTATNTLTDSGTFSCPMTKSKQAPFRSEWKIIDKNNMTYTMYGQGFDGGKEFKQMELVFKRK